MGGPLPHVKAEETSGHPPSQPAPPTLASQYLKLMVQGQSYGWNGSWLNKTKPKEQQQGQEQPSPPGSPSSDPTPGIPARECGTGHPAMAQLR